MSLPQLACCLPESLTSRRINRAMSAIGTKQTLDWCPRMSAFGGKADMASASQNASVVLYPPVVLTFFAGGFAELIAGLLRAN